MTIERGSRLPVQGTKRSTLADLSFQALAIIGQHRLVRRNQYGASIGIDDEPFTIINTAIGTLNADHRRHVHATRQNSRVRSAPA